MELIHQRPFIWDSVDELSQAGARAGASASACETCSHASGMQHGRQAGRLAGKNNILLVSCDNFALRTGILEWSFERMICFRRSALASATTKPSEQERN